MAPPYVTSSFPGIKVYDRVKVPSRPEMGEVMRIAEIARDYQADVAFDTPGGKRWRTCGEDEPATTAPATWFVTGSATVTPSNSTELKCRQG